MRIIGGRLRGKTIMPPSGYKARPTTDFAKEGLFNVLDNEYEFEDLKVLDLFGGTGAIAFEFASRGAAKVYSVEMARENASFIISEAKRLGLGNVVMVRDNVFDFLPLCREKFDIVFADPPWKVLSQSRTRSSKLISYIRSVILSSNTPVLILSRIIRVSKRKKYTAKSIFLFSNKFYLDIRENFPYFAFPFEGLAQLV